MKRSVAKDYLPGVRLRAAVVAGSIFLTLAACSKQQSDASNPPTGAASSPASGPAGAPPSAPSAAPSIQIPEGTLIEARVNETLSTARNRVGDPFTASLEVPLDIGGREVLPRGARLRGHVSTSRSSGRLEGRATIGITLDRVEYNGQEIPITTTLDTKSGPTHKKRNIEVIGGGSGLGAVIGAIAGGGKGAAIGAVAGAGAGVAADAATGKEQVEIPAETVFTFRLKTPVELR